MFLPFKRVIMCWNSARVTTMSSFMTTYLVWKADSRVIDTSDISCMNLHHSRDKWDDILTDIKF